MTHSPFLPQPVRSAPLARTPAVLRKARREIFAFWFLILDFLEKPVRPRKGPRAKTIGVPKTVLPNQPLLQSNGPTAQTV